MDDFQKILAEYAKSSQTTGGQKTQSSPLVDMLTARLTEQSKGISTSASSELQNSINAAMKDTRLAGAATSARLQSERSREVAYAEDRAGAQFTTALEGRTGYATQVAGLRELTETTTKSIRDLDQRYQEALLTNDANTASALAGLRIKKLELQQEAEERYMDNLFKAVSLEMEEKQFNLSFGQQREKMTIDMLANERGYQLDKIKLAQDKELSKDELAFKYASLAQDRDLTIRQIEATLSNKKGGSGENATNVTSYILDSLRTKSNAGSNVNDRAAMAAEIRSLLDASGLTEDMGASDYSKYLSAAYDIFNKEQSAKESLGMDTKEGNKPRSTVLRAYPGAPENIGPFLFKMPSSGQSIY